MLRVALGDDPSQLTHVANPCPEALFETVAEALAGLPGTGKMDGDALFPSIFVVLGFFIFGGFA
jgi:hypothetical protein